MWVAFAFAFLVAVGLNAFGLRLRSATVEHLRYAGMVLGIQRNDLVDSQCRLLDPCDTPTSGACKYATSDELSGMIFQAQHDLGIVQRAVSLVEFRMPSFSETSCFPSSFSAK